MCVKDGQVIKKGRQENVLYFSNVPLHHSFVLCPQPHEPCTLSLLVFMVYHNFYRQPYTVQPNLNMSLQVFVCRAL